MESKSFEEEGTDQWVCRVRGGVGGQFKDVKFYSESEDESDTSENVTWKSLLKMTDAASGGDFEHRGKTMRLVSWLKRCRGSVIGIHAPQLWYSHIQSIPKSQV